MLWRRTKLGLRLSAAERPALDEFMDGAAQPRRRGQRTSPAAGSQEGGDERAKLEETSRRVGGGIRHIRDVSLTLERGSLNVLLGPTLSGKTSLMRLMAGLDVPTSGRVLVRRRGRHRRAVQKRNVAMVYQQFINYPR